MLVSYMQRSKEHSHFTKPGKEAGFSIFGSLLCLPNHLQGYNLISLNMIFLSALLCFLFGFVFSCFQLKDFSSPSQKFFGDLKPTSRKNLKKKNASRSVSHDGCEDSGLGTGVSFISKSRERSPTNWSTF